MARRIPLITDLRFMTFLARLSDPWPIPGLSPRVDSRSTLVWIIDRSLIDKTTLHETRAVLVIGLLKALRQLLNSLTRSLYLVVARADRRMKLCNCVSASSVPLIVLH
jgi:hypothetical protein